MQTKKFNVLLAEDNPVSAKSIMHIFSKLHCNMLWVKNGKEAVEAVKAIDDSQPEDRFHLILMDLEMPVMNGFDAALAIRSHEYRLMLQNTHSVYYSIPIVVVTGERHLVECGQDLFIGVKKIVYKPLTVNIAEEILQTIVVQKNEETNHH